MVVVYVWNDKITCMVNYSKKVFTVFIRTTYKQYKFDTVADGQLVTSVNRVEVKTRKALTNLVTLLRCNKEFEEV